MKICLSLNDVGEVSLCHFSSKDPEVCPKKNYAVERFFI